MKEYRWKDKNEFGSPELLYAAGATIASWNLCEMSMLSLFYTFVGPEHISSKTFALLGNDSRQDLLMVSANNSELSVKKLLAGYVRHYSICAGNRNLIAHSLYLIEPSGKVENLKKFQKYGTNLNTFDVDEETMLEIADSCFLTYMFGMEIAIYAGKFPEVMIGKQPVGPKPQPLPEIPIPPRALVARSREDQKNGSLLPLTFSQSE